MTARHDRPRPALGHELLRLDDLPSGNVCFVGVRGRPDDRRVESIRLSLSMPVRSACSFALYVLAMCCPEALSGAALAKVAAEDE